MSKLKFKSLVKKFSYDRLLIECEKQGWRLPTLEETRCVSTEHTVFWVADKPEDKKDIVSHHLLVDGDYNTWLVNKKAIHNVVVIVTPKTCFNCSKLHSCFLLDCISQESYVIVTTNMSCEDHQFKPKG